MATENKKTLKITLTPISDNTFDIEVYEPESGEYRLIKCSDDGDLTEFNEEIMSWVSIMRDEAEQENELTYPELEGIHFIMYKSNQDGDYHVVNISDKKQKDGEGCPWYKGAYGNCLIALNHAKITDRLYLYDAKAAEQAIKEINRDDMLPDWGDVKQYATKIIERRGSDNE